MGESSTQADSPKRPSRLGVLSIAIAVCVPLLWVVMFALGVLIGTRTEVGNYLGLAALGVAISAPLFHLLGSVIGLAGLISRTTNNLMPVTGMILNLLLGTSGIYF